MSSSISGRYGEASCAGRVDRPRGLRVGDRVRAFVYDVRARAARTTGVPVAHLDPQFMAELFETEVPEIYDGIIEIKAVARDPGSRAKIAVISDDSGIDPVAPALACAAAACRRWWTNCRAKRSTSSLVTGPGDVRGEALPPAEVSQGRAGREQRADRSGGAG